MEQEDKKQEEQTLEHDLGDMVIKTLKSNPNVKDASNWIENNFSLEHEAYVKNAKMGLYFGTFFAILTKVDDNKFVENLKQIYEKRSRELRYTAPEALLSDYRLALEMAQME